MLLVLGAKVAAESKEQGWAARRGCLRDASLAVRDASWQQKGASKAKAWQLPVRWTPAGTRKASAGRQPGRALAWAPAWQQRAPARRQQGSAGLERVSCSRGRHHGGSCHHGSGGCQAFPNG